MTVRMVSVGYVVRKGETKVEKKLTRSEAFPAAKVNKILSYQPCQLAETYRSFWGHLYPPDHGLM